MKATTLDSPPGRDAFTVAEVCYRTGLSRDAVYAAIRSGKLIARKLGRRMLITEKDVRRFLANLPKAGAARRHRYREDCYRR